MNTSKEHLPEDQPEAIFQEKIKPIIFKDIQIASLPPVAIISGGQPGSGKSRMLDLVAHEFKGSLAPAIISGDDFRGYHPLYETYIEQDDQTAAVSINPANHLRRH